MKLQKWEIKAYLLSVLCASLLPGILLVVGLAMKVEWAVYVLLSLGSMALFALAWVLLIDPFMDHFDPDA